MVDTGDASDHALRDHHLDDAEVLSVRTTSAEALADDLLEGEAEVAREQGVDARIDGRIAIAQPEEDGEEGRRDAFGTECPHDVHREEWHPAHDEATYNNPCKHLCRTNETKKKKKFSLLFYCVMLLR